MKKLLVFMFGVFMFMGCGGGDSGGGNGGGGTPQGDVSVSGTVVHSVFSSGDKVCYDRNGNKKCDAGEPSAQIGSGGVYTLAGTDADAAAVAIVAELAKTTSGTSSLNAVSNSVLIFEAPAGQRVISSLSTIVKAKMDSDPSLSFDDAHLTVQTDLGTSADLFSASSAVAALAAEVTAVIVAMFDDLAARFGITISDKVIMLVMSEIIPQLTDIASGKTPDEVVGDTTGGMTETDINDKMDDLAETMPKIMSMTDVFDKGLQAYEFAYSKIGMPDDNYGFYLYSFSKSALRLYANGSYNQALPDTTNGQNIENFTVYPNNDGSVNLSHSRLANLEIIPVDGKAINANPRHNNKAINFTSGAVMYKMNMVDVSAFPSLSYIRGNCGTRNLDFSCGPVAVNGNTVEIRWSEEKYDIEMNNSGTYEIIPKRIEDSYDIYEVFTPKLTMYKGKYEKTTDSYGDVYTFKDLDGRTVFAVFMMDSSYYFAGEFGMFGAKILFNKTAAEDIKSQW